MPSSQGAGCDKETAMFTSGLGLSRRSLAAAWAKVSPRLFAAQGVLAAAKASAITRCPVPPLVATSRLCAAARYVCLLPSSFGNALRMLSYNQEPTLHTPCRSPDDSTYWGW